MTTIRSIGLVMTQFSSGLLCVECDVKPYTLTHSLMIHFERELCLWNEVVVRYTAGRSTFTSLRWTSSLCTHVSVPSSIYCNFMKIGVTVTTLEQCVLRVSQILEHSVLTKMIIRVLKFEKYSSKLGTVNKLINFAFTITRHFTWFSWLSLSVHFSKLFMLCLLGLFYIL